jgi:hypothetical protein
LLSPDSQSKKIDIFTCLNYLPHREKKVSDIYFHALIQFFLNSSFVASFVIQRASFGRRCPKEA